MFGRQDLFISPEGNDNWSGALAEPNAEKNDGPLATLGKARDVVRERKRTGRLAEPVTVWLRGGRYPIKEPVVFGPEDSAPVAYRAYPDEEPVLDGGRRIEGWQPTQVNGVDAWVADVPGTGWTFRQLFVNGERRRRARLPKEGFFWMEDVPGTPVHSPLFAGSDTFRAAPGDVQPWRNLSDVEVVVTHYWTGERMPIASYDPETRLVRSTRKSIFALTDDFQPRHAKYTVENVFEALTEPGEWYLDRAEGKVYYIPMPGEDPETAEVVAPVATQLLKLVGKPEEGRYVEFLRFEGLTFRHAEWVQPGGGAEGAEAGGAADKYADYASAPQAASNVPGTIFLRGARACAIEECTLEHLGWYGIELAEGCTGNRIVGNEIRDLGAGGVKLNGSDAEGPLALRTGNNRVTDNHIHDGGEVFPAAVGILSVHSFGNALSHNHIHGFYYTGISCGWVWGFRESVSRDNRIEKNHIHDLGRGVLSDMGGVYTLGVQPGTVIRGNLIHDVEKSNYGGWAIYTDEGSSHILIENNVCYNTSSQSFFQHYGRENTVRNNIWVFGREGLVSLGRAQAHLAFTFERNIVLCDGQPLFREGYGAPLTPRNFISDLNLFWDVSAPEPHALAKTGEKLSFDEWQALGYDRHSLVADPGFADAAAGDFRLPDDSPAFSLGFEPVDLSDVGPRPKGERE